MVPVVAGSSPVAHPSRSPANRGFSGLIAAEAYRVRGTNAAQVLAATNMPYVWRAGANAGMLSGSSTRIMTT